MGLSIRAYARHRGVSHVAVKKAIDTGRITALADGTIDPDSADAQWAKNTLQPRKPEQTAMASDTAKRARPDHAVADAPRRETCRPVAPRCYRLAPSTKYSRPSSTRWSWRSARRNW